MIVFSFDFQNIWYFELFAKMGISTKLEFSYSNPKNILLLHLLWSGKVFNYCKLAA
jgi:hypothetical protein